MNDLTVMDKEIQEELIHFLCQQFYVEVEDIHVDESLVDSGIIDSIGLIEIAAYIQKRYEYKVKNEEMNKENFGSVNKITKFIANQLSPQQQQ